MSYKYKIAFLGKKPMKDWSGGPSRLFVSHNNSEQWDDLLSNFPDRFKKIANSDIFDTIASKEKEHILWGFIDIDRQGKIHVPRKHMSQDLDKESYEYFYYDNNGTPIILFGPVGKILQTNSEEDIEKLILELASKRWY